MQWDLKLPVIFACPEVAPLRFHPRKTKLLTTVCCLPMLADILALFGEPSEGDEINI